MIGDRWGVSQSEVLRAYPCDGFVASPLLQAWRGISIEAPAGAVWPWVAQVRLAPYSYDWVDNRGRRSPRELAGLPEPRAGDRFTAVGGRPLGRIVSVDPGRQLTGTIMGAFMSYVLVPQDDGATRLLLKVTARSRPQPADQGPRQQRDRPAALTRPLPASARCHDAHEVRARYIVDREKQALALTTVAMAVYRNDSKKCRSVRAPRHAEQIARAIADPALKAQALAAMAGNSFPKIHANRKFPKTRKLKFLGVQ